MTVPLGKIDTARYPYVLFVAGEVSPKRRLLPAYTLPAAGGAFATPSGPNTLTGIGADGKILFVQPFEANVAVQFSSESGFNLAIPLAAGAYAGLARLELTAGGRTVSESRRSSGPPVVRAVRVGPEAIGIVWNGDQYPEARVDTPDGGFVIAGHGAASNATIESQASSLTIRFSNGVTSETVTVTVTQA